MTKETTDASRQHRILKALIEHGPLSLPGIRKQVYKPVHEDLRVLRKAGYIVEAGRVPAGKASPVKELPAYKATPQGLQYAGVELQPVRRGPGKHKDRKELVITKASKATVKLKPVDDMEVTYTDDTKFTTYVPKYEFKPYNPPKNFMECVR